MSASTQRKLKQAYDRLHNGDAAAAAALCEAVLMRTPRDADALWLLGAARLMQERPADATPLLERAVEFAPAHGAALENLGVAYLMLSRFVDAERVLRTTATIPGAPPSVQMRLGVALLNQERYAEAEVELQGALARAPGDADTLYNLGVASFEAGAVDRARGWLEQALRERRSTTKRANRLAARISRSAAIRMR